MKKTKRDRSGVAVIIVLGMLALLMMMGVAFSVSMRVERRSAGNYSHSVGTKNLIWAGLSRAMERIEDEMSQDGGYMFPPEDIWVSENPGEQKIHVSLGRGEAMDYVPGTLWDQVFDTRSEWVNFSVTWLSGGIRSTNVPGRFAYLILNCSDYIDANYIGDSNRLGGASVEELQLVDAASPNNGILSQADLDDFLDARDIDVRYETIQEQAGLSEITNDYFVVYSRFPVGELIDPGGPNESVSSNLLYIGAAVDGGNFVSKADFNKKMGEMLEADEGIKPSPDRLDYLYDAFVDYLDEDCIPTDLESPCTESVPMINEVYVNKPMITRYPLDSTTNYAFGALIDIETLYPFLKESEHKFNVEGEVDIEIERSVLNTSVLSNMTFIVKSGYQTGDISVYKKAGGDPGTADSKSPTIMMRFGADSNSTFKVTLKVSKLVVKGDDPGATCDDEIVDSVEGEFVFEYDETGVLPFGAPVPLNDIPSYEAVDPRFNWLVEVGGDGKPSQASHFKVCQTGNTIDPPATNSYAKWSFDLRAANIGRIERNGDMYVSDRKRLSSVGELGHLVRSQSLSSFWQTLRLFDQKGGSNIAKRDHIFRYFTVSSNSVARGSINLNSKDRDVLKTAFRNMPLNYPESGNPITDANVNKILDMISAYRDTKDFYNVSDLVDLDWEANFPGQSDLAREAMLAYSYGLLGTRQNLFVVIIAASPVTTGMGEYARHEKDVAALGSKRAIAYVWRDPYPEPKSDTNDPERHRCFVQFFKWLEN